MRTLVLAAVLLVGCGEVDPAGGIGLGGAGGTGQAGSTGSAGTGGDQAMTGGTTGTGGAAAMPSCNIPVGMITGVDTMAVLKQCSTSSVAQVHVVDGAVTNFFNAAEWTVASFTIWQPNPGDPCAVDIRFEMPTHETACTTADRLFVHLTVPAL